MENRTPKNRYNGSAALDAGKTTEKPDALKLLETAMDKRAGDIAQIATDMFRFMSITASAQRSFFTVRWHRHSVSPQDIMT